MRIFTVVKANGIVKRQAFYVKIVITPLKISGNLHFSASCLLLIGINMSYQITSSNPVVKAIIEGTAPRPARLAAARGILPLSEEDKLEILVALTQSGDEELAARSDETLRGEDEDVLTASALSPATPENVLDFLAQNSRLPQKVHEAVLMNPKTPAAAILALAQATANEHLLELIAFNQQLLIQSPALINAILENSAASSEAARRASETRREFFEKERGLQQIAAELRAQGKDAAAEFIEKAEFSAGDDADMSFDDAMFIASMIETPDQETDDAWLGLEFLEEIYEETEGDRQRIVDKIMGEMRFEDGDIPNERISIINRIMRMGMKDRVRMAMKGDREARNILIRDPNRLVATAVVANPRITEQEVEKIASMRTVTEDILRQIAASRQWSRSYQIAHNLAKNPRTPIANVLNIMSRLQLRDLAALSKNRNVSDAVRRQALRLSQARTGH